MVSSFLFIFAGMEKIYNYYQDIVTAYTRRADNLKKKIHLLGSIRLLLVAGLIAMVWFFKSEDWKVLAGIAVLFTIPFIALMVWHTKLFARKCYAEALANLCKNELNGLDYDFSAFDGAPEKSSAEHSFSLDLDLFGNHSLFQSVNRTVTFMGKREAGRLVYATTHRQGYDIKTPGSDPRTGIVHTAPATFLCDRHSASGKQGDHNLFLY